MAMNPSLLRMLPGLFHKSPLTADEKTPFIHAGTLMALEHVDFLPVVIIRLSAGGHLYHTIGRFAGLTVVNALRQVHGPELFEKAVRDFCDHDIGTIDIINPPVLILDKIAETGFGHVCITERNELVAITGLRDIIHYAHSFGLNESIKSRDVASPIESLPSTATLTQLFDALTEKRIRRMVVTGPDHPKIADEHTIIDFTFSYDGLRMLKQNPERFYQWPLYSLPLEEAGTIKGDTPLSEVWPLIYTNPAECLLIENENKILTPWDIVIKPHLRTKPKLNNNKNSQNHK
jgi:CBS domain-containing protein